MAKKHRISTLNAKILVLLEAGLALGLTRSYRKQQWILKQVPKELEKIDRQVLNRAIRSLYESRLIKEKYHRDGTSTFILSKNGQRYALKFNLYEMKIQHPKTWDKKWRIIMFDIPERLKFVRESLRMHFRQLGTIELQKSVFISP